MKTAVALLLACLLVFSMITLSATPQKNAQPVLRDGKSGHGHTLTVLADEVRHQLITLPYYGVFDWLEAQVLPDDSVILRGQVVVDSTKSDAEARVRKLEGVTKVVNQIEILPAMPNDQQIRHEVYRAIYKFDGPLFQYAERAVPPIHIIVKGGHVTLKGVVGNAMDKQLAFTAASGIPGVFDVQNELAVEK
jgi:hyperosmotically inducible protein